MLRDPSHWRSYYHGTEAEIRRDRIFAYSDRCRYYWHQPAVQQELARLLENLRAHPISLNLISQFLRQEYEAIRTAELRPTPEQLIQSHIRRVLRVYADACHASETTTLGTREM